MVWFVEVVVDERVDLVLYCGVRVLVDVMEVVFVQLLEVQVG